MKISKYVTRYELGEYTAFYHSLRMKPVFLSLKETLELDQAVKQNKKPNLPVDVLDSLKLYLILVETDDGVLQHVQHHVPKPYICLAYFVLSEQCNLACKYCFLGNAKKNTSKITKNPMSKKTADKALEFFSRQTCQDMSQFHDEKEIIFYGGEPLINFETLKYVVKRSKYYQSKGKISHNLNFSVITNGLLLDEEKINFLIEKNINVSISIDGSNEFANADRVDKNGKNIFTKLHSKLILAKQLGLKFGLSITLTENTLNNMEQLLKLLEELNVESICFNILLKSKNYNIKHDYYIDATDFIIEFYKKTKHTNIYEDRFMRKLKAFVESKIYFSDCGATSGSQIVITPDGNVGICHGCMENREYFIGSVFDDTLIAEKHKEIIRWSKTIPIFKQECQNCPCLGICGGGCPINAEKISDNHSIDNIDKTFCIHANKILEYLIKELLRLLLTTI